MRFLKWSIFIIVLITGGVYLWQIQQSPEIKYLTETAKKQYINETVLADGTLEAYQQVSVGSQVSGQIKKLHFKLGDSVRQDDLLIEIDDLPQKNALADAKARLKNIQATKAAKLANLENANLTFIRQNQLTKQGASRVSELDNAKAQLLAIQAEIEAIDAQISQAQVALDTASLNLSYTKIIAPIDGVIVALIVDEGQTVNSVQSAPTLIKIANLNTMSVKAQISEADVVKIKTGMPVYFTILGDKQRYDAKLRQIEPAPESIKQDIKASSSTTEAIYYNGIFDVNNPHQTLRISMTAQVVIVIKEQNDALVIPMSAITFTQDKATVRVLNANQIAEVRQITLGINNNINAQVLNGIEEGEAIILSDSTEQKSKQMPRGMGKP